MTPPFPLDAALARTAEALAFDLQPGSLAERACAIQALEWRRGYDPVLAGEAGAWARAHGLVTGTEDAPHWTEFAGYFFARIGLVPEGGDPGEE